MSTVFGAASRDDVERIRALVAGCDAEGTLAVVRARSDAGSTALHAAASTGSARAAAELLSLGAEIGSRDVEACASPLHVALGRGHFGVTLVLVRGGALADDDVPASRARSLDGWASSPLGTPPNAATNTAPRDRAGATPADELFSMAAPLVRSMRAATRAARKHLADSFVMSNDSSGGGHSGNRGRLASSDAASDTVPMRRPRFSSSDSSTVVPQRLRFRSDDAADVSVFGRLAAGGSVEVFDEVPAPLVCSSARSDAFFEDLHHADWATPAPPRRGPLPMDVPDDAGSFTTPPALAQARACANIACAPSVGAPATADDDAREWSWRSPVFAWGEDQRQLGFVSGARSASSPRGLDVEEIDERIVSVSAGAHHSLLLTADGSVLAFGDGTGGRLGLGSLASPNDGSSRCVSATQPARVTFPVAPNSRFVVSAIAAGPRHSLALAGGVLFAWGDGASGALGLGALSGDGTVDFEISSPRRVEGGALRRVRLIAIAAGAHHSLAVDATGSAFAWGSNWASQLGARELAHAPSRSREKPPAPSGPWTVWTPRRCDALRDGNPIIALAAGDSYSLLATSDGDVFCAGCGNGDWTRLSFDAGAADRIDAIADFRSVSARIASTRTRARGRSIAASSSNATALAALASYGFSFAQSHEATGGESNADDGSWSTVSTRRMAAVESPRSGGGSSSAKRGAAALSSPAERVSRPAYIRAVSAGRSHALAIDATGRIWAWGAPGTDDLCGFSDEDSPQSCGGGSSGAGGSGGGSSGAATGLDVWPQWGTPRRLPFFSNAAVPIIRVSAGVLHSVAVDDEGRVFSWGSSRAHDRGLLGHAPSIGGGAAQNLRANVPRRVQTLAQALDAAAGAHHTLVLCGVYSPPLPPLRPSVADYALTALRGERASPRALVLDDDDPRIELSPIVELWGAASIPPPRANSDTPLRADAAWARAREGHRIYAPIVAAEISAGRDLASLWRDGECGGDAISLATTPTDAATVFVVPSLRSLCERALLSSGAVRDISSAARMLILGRRHASHGLCAFAGAFLAANAGAMLAATAAPRSRDLLCGVDMIDVAGELASWGWAPQRVLTANRLAACESLRARIRLFKAFKRRIAGLIRPSGKWGGLNPRLPRLLEAAAVDEAVRVRALLFAGTHGSVADDEEVNQGRGDTAATVVAAHGDGDSTAFDGAPSAAALAALLATPRAQQVGEAGFHAAFRTIMFARASSGGSSASPRAARSAGAHTGSDGDSVGEAAHERGNDGGGSGGGRASGEASPATLPAHLCTNLPPGAPAGSQSSLDRLAANLAEVGAGVGQSGYVRVLSGVRVGSRSSARRMISDMMVDDASAILRRIRTLRKKLGEASALALSAVTTRGARAFKALHAEQLGKLSRRGPWAAEAFVYSPHIVALQALVRTVLEDAALDADYAARLADLDADIAAVIVLLDELRTVGLDDASLVAAGITEATPAADVMTAAALVAAGATPTDAVSAIVGASLAQKTKVAAGSSASDVGSTPSPLTVPSPPSSPVLLETALVMGVTGTPAPTLSPILARLAQADYGRLSPAAAASTGAPWKKIASPVPRAAPAALATPTSPTSRSIAAPALSIAAGASQQRPPGGSPQSMSAAKTVPSTPFKISVAPPTSPSHASRGTPSLRNILADESARAEARDARDVWEARKARELEEMRLPTKWRPAALNASTSKSTAQSLADIQRAQEAARNARPPSSSPAAGNNAWRLVGAARDRATNAGSGAGPI